MAEPRFLFFSGKGGVGKTSHACAAAVGLADRGLRTLIVTTDPASNLADVFLQPIGPEPVAVAGVPNLWAVEIDPDAASQAYRERILAPMAGKLPEHVLAVVQEQLNSPCTDEVASFDRFIQWMDAPGYDRIVFDTAPTGHTLRLLQLPGDWADHIRMAEGGSGQTCLGPVQMLGDARERYERALALLRDPSRTHFVFVAQPEETPLREVQRSALELERIGIRPAALIVNGLLPEEACVDPFFQRRREMQLQALDWVRHELGVSGGMRIETVPLLPLEVRGPHALRFLAALRDAAAAGPSVPRPPGSEEPAPEPPPGAAAPPSNPWTAPLVAAVHVVPAAAGTSGQRCVLFAGKGGVGKTVMACATALWTARRGLDTLLISTDPASHLADVLGHPVGPEPAPLPGEPHLHVARIDPEQAFAAYKRRVLEETAAAYGPEMVALLEEQLDSPCTQEMASFHRFLDFFLDRPEQVLIFDTAPTGHTLRLLELPLQWGSKAPDGRLQAAVAKLRDPLRTTVALVVYPETTPILEAERASRDLEEMGIATGFVVVNMVLPEERCRDEFFRRRSRLQQRQVAGLPARFGAPLRPAPLLDGAVAGRERLWQLAEAVYGKGEDLFGPEN